jgi:glycosidase
MCGRFGNSVSFSLINLINIRLGNAQNERLSSRTSSRLHAELLLMVELLLPGTPILYYGDELGVQDAQDTVTID